MNQTFTVREAKRSDLEKIINLAVESMIYSQSPHRQSSLEEVKQYRKKDLSRLYSLFGQPQLGLYVAQGEKIIGHVIVLTGTTESVSGEEQGWVIDLSVQPEYWGKGVAKKLALKAENFVKQKGLKYIGLGVTTVNERAVRFYERLGYLEERKRMIKTLG